MNFGSKLLLIALTTMHLHTEVNKSLFLPLPLPLIEGFYQNMYLRIIYCIEKQKVKLFGSRQKWLTSRKKCEYWLLMGRVYRGTIFNKF